MSKFLKLIVNLFLIAAILVAVAILVPPLAGITTTIVDSSSMDTNLPLGSITYSTGVDVHQLEVGDEILKVNGTSTYAYFLKTCDPDKGSFEAVSIADPAGQPETISLRNTVSKVAVMIPYIGYVLIAMRSMEGVIIIALVVVLMIILFILSELWKPDRDDEEGEDEEEVVAGGLDADDESGIDTAAIRAAVKDNIAAINQEDGSGEQNQSRAERKAAKKEKRRREKTKAARREETPEDTSEDTSEDTATAAPENEVEDKTGSAGMTAEEAGFFGEDLEAALTRTAGAPADSSAADEASEEASVPAEEENSAESTSVPEDSPSFNEPPAGSHVSDVVSAVEEVMKGITINEQRREEIPPLEEEAAPAAQAAEQIGTETPDDGSRFRKVKRPTLEEIEEEVKEDGGTDADLKKDRNTGVTIVDYTELL